MRSTEAFPNIYTFFSGSERHELYLSAYEYSSWDLASVKSKIAESWNLKAADIGALELTGSVFGNDRAASVTTQQEWNWVCSQIQGAVGDVIITPREPPENLMQAALESAHVAEANSKLEEMTKQRDGLQQMVTKQGSKIAEQSKANAAQALELARHKDELNSLASKLAESEAAKDAAIKERDELRLLAQTLESTPAPSEDHDSSSGVEVLQYQFDSLAAEVASLKIAAQAHQPSTLLKPSVPAQVPAPLQANTIDSATHTPEVMQLLCKTQSETLAMLKATNESYLAQASDFAATLKATRETALFQLEHLKTTSHAKMSQLRSLNQCQAKELAVLKAAREAERCSTPAAAGSAARLQHEWSGSQSLSEASLRQASQQDLRASFAANHVPPSVASSVSGFDVINDDLEDGSDDEIPELW